MVSIGSKAPVLWWPSKVGRNVVATDDVARFSIPDRPDARSPLAGSCPSARRSCKLAHELVVEAGIFAPQQRWIAEQSLLWAGAITTHLNSLRFLRASTNPSTVRCAHRGSGGRHVHGLFDMGLGAYQIKR
jgi:hypothetical protein